MLYRHLIALPLVYACLCPVWAQTPPAAPDTDADRQALTQAIEHDDLAKAATLLDADPAIVKRLNNYRRLPLQDALENDHGDGKLKLLDLLLARGADINAADPQGQTPLTQALSSDNLSGGKTFVYLVSHGASLTKADGDGRAPLHAAAAQDEREAVNRLLSGGVSVNSRDAYDNTALHLAIAAGSPDVAVALINAGADINLRNGRGDTPLHLAMRLAALPGGAASATDVGTAKSTLDDTDRDDGAALEALLIKRGAKVDLPDRYSLTPLLYALLNRDPADRLLLLKHHATVDTQTAFFQAAALGDVPTLTRLARTNPALPTLRAASGATPLHVAALWNARRAVAWLLKHGAAPNARDAFALTPLDSACRAPAASGAAADLIAAGADVSAESAAGETPLFYAVRAQAGDAVRLLLARHAAVNVRNARGETPLMVVTEFDPLTVVSSLLNAGADANIRYRQGNDDNVPEGVLCSAIDSGSVGAVKLLLAKGADPNLAGSTGSTPLSQAVQSGSKEMVVLLLNAGADPRQKGYGNLPLQFAQDIHRTEIAALIQAKLDATTK